MKRTNQILWGFVLLAIGLIWGGNTLGITDIDLFFDGWWTLFIIVPCFIGLLSGKDILGSLIGMGIGVLLLLNAQDILNLSMVWKLLVPSILVLIGIRIIFGSVNYNRKSKEVHVHIEHSATEDAPKSQAPVRSWTAVFSGEELKFSNETFDGINLTSVFGGIDLDLRSAIIEHDCTIRATSVFGGVDILVPDNVNVKISSNSVFGGIENKASHRDIPGAPTLYIQGTCLFGGVDIK